ncbi:MAG TPA: gephyrin-like molybdotransferase Glp [Candidatus Methylomirabilis sp.]|nr:gephyrin-like molybdotransferase Glp [Candidatus Methylomirabilis sp.]
MPELFQVLSVDEAAARFLPRIAPLPDTEVVPVAEALGRVTAEEVASPMELPAFSRSNMDGFSVRAEDTFGATEGLPAYLKVVGEVPMGQAPTVRLNPGEAAKAHTGGMLAEGADAIVIVEHTQAVDATTIEVVRPAAPGENVIQVGEDVRKGQILLPAGRWLRAQDLGGLAAVGITAVRVRRRPRVTIVSSGDEVVPPDREPGPGQVRDINTYTLSAMVREAGGIAVPLGIAPDREEPLRALAQRAMAEGDLAVFSAGSSVSIRDITAKVIDSLGRPGVLVHGLSIKPGKPTILALVEGKPVVGLPGNPVSAIVIAGLFVLPAIAALLGLRELPRRAEVAALLGKNVNSIPGREDYVPVRLTTKDGVLTAEPVFGKSNLIFTLVRADGLVKVPADASGIPAGERVTVRLF